MNKPKKQDEENKGFDYFPITGMWLQPTKVKGKKFYKGCLGKDLDVLLFPNTCKTENAPAYNLVFSRKIK